MVGYYIAAKIQSLELEEKPVVGVVATTLCDGRDPMVMRGLNRFEWMAPIVFPILNALPDSLMKMRLPIRWVSKMDKIANDKALARVVINDQLGGGNWVPIHFLHSILTNVPEVEPEAFRLCPVLLAHPERDQMTPLELSLSFFHKLSAEKQLVVLKDAGHIPNEEPGWSELDLAIENFVRDKVQL